MPDSWETGPLAPIVIPLTYKSALVPRDAERHGGRPGHEDGGPALEDIHTAAPLGGVVPSLTNTCPSPNAKAVGVVTPVATSWSFAPLAGFGIGVVAAEAVATSATHTTAQAISGLKIL